MSVFRVDLEDLSNALTDLERSKVKHTQLNGANLVFMHDLEIS